MEVSQDIDLKQYTRLIYRKRYLLVAISVLVTTIIVAVSYVLPTLYEAKSTVLIERNFLNDIMKGIASTPSIDDRAKAVSTVMQSRPLILKVIKDLDLDTTQKSEAELEGLVSNFQKRTETKVEVNKASRKDMDSFVVSVKHSNPAIARDYVNALVRRYIEESLSAKREETYGASKFLLEQIDRFKEKINTIEAQIAEISKQTGTVTDEKLIAYQKKLDDLLLQYTDNHPEVIKVKDELQALKTQARARGKSNRKPREREQGQAAMGLAGQKPDNQTGNQEGARDFRNGSDSHANKLQDDAEINNIPKKGSELKIKELERDRDTYRKIYEDMVAALGRSEVSSNIEVSDKGGTFRILEPAVLPRSPVSPNRVKIILLGIVAGIGAGIGVIILFDMMHSSVNSVSAARAFSIPVLAVIPHVELAKEQRNKMMLDMALYIFAGAYYAGVAAILIREVIGKEM
jgi:polysaccharide biosynthesis transport protein